MTSSETAPKRSVRQWGLGVAAVAVATLLLPLLPSEDEAQAPFVVTAEPGETAHGRVFSARTTGAAWAAELVSGAWRMRGNWLVVDIEITGNTSEIGVRLAHASLTVGDRSYRASERVPTGIAGQGLTVGIAQAGSLAFELPEDVSGGSAVLHLAAHPDTRLDSLIEVPLDLSELGHSEEIEIVPVDWVKSAAEADEEWWLE